MITIVLCDLCIVLVNLFFCITVVCIIINELFHSGIYEFILYNSHFTLAYEWYSSLETNTKISLNLQSSTVVFLSLKLNTTLVVIYGNQHQNVAKPSKYSGIDYSNLAL